MSKYSKSRDQRELLLIPIMGLFLTIVPLLLLSVSFVHVGSINISLPTLGVVSREQKAVMKDDIITVKLQEDHTLTLVQNDLVLKNTKLEASAIYDYLKLSIPNNIKTSTIVFIDIADQIPYADMIQIIDALRDRGFYKISVYK